MTLAFPKPKKRTKSRVKTLKASLHLMRVKQLPCVVCGVSPCDAHHCRSDSFGGGRASDYATIPLCKEHHQVGPDAFHANKGKWERENGPDWSYISEMLEMLGIDTSKDF